jgi:hypothetical protein
MNASTTLLLLGAALVGTSLGAQETTVATATTRKDSTPDVSADSTTRVKDAAKSTTAVRNLPPVAMQYYRMVDQRGLNVFETTKDSGRAYDGFQLSFDAAFTQQFQGLGHSNTAAPKVATGTTVNANQLIQMGHGFNNAVANLYLNAQLARGIRVQMTSYLSARHHNETWVKDGYVQIDDTPFEFRPLTELMRYVTVKAGHFEVNYGDAHFRRTDNGHALYNPLVGNYILDAFTTSIGTEVYLKPAGLARGFFVMGGVTNGEVRGTVLNAPRRAPAFLGKAGFDRQLSPDLRVRLTGSWLSQARAANQTLYSGDRGGSRYYDVLESSTSTEAAQAWSGAINPGFNTVHAAVINPFVKYRGLEFFGNFEQSNGRQAAETANRKWTQNVVEGTYRLWGDRLYASARHNSAKGTLVGITPEVSIDRVQVGGGWFVNPLIMVKGEWVNQDYNNFPTTDIRSGGKFKGFVLEGVVAF